MAELRRLVEPKLAHGAILASTSAMYVEQSWQRSARHGLQKNEAPGLDPARLSDLNFAREQSQQLMVHAAPVMESLYNQIIDTESMVVLTDSSGLILHSIGDDSFLVRAEKVALSPGVAWSEERRGTNAVGTCIVEGAPTIVHADQHYLSANHFLTCSASPIHAPSGELMGVLDVSGDHRGFHKHTMGLVRMSAQMIENTLFRRAYGTQLIVAFHSRPEFIGTLMEGLIAFEADGRVLSANESACFQTGLSLTALRTHTAQSLLQTGVSALIAHLRRDMMVPISGVVPSGVKVYAMPSGEVFRQRIALSDTPAAYHAPAASCTTELPLATLDQLDTGDATISAVIARLRKVAPSDVCVLFEGETGVGKEWFARALHRASPRAPRPFVAVNCASIPEGLIESELFGYEEGAFTGARRRGSPGKIVAAHGGTLFLDEVGDMPMSMQARLLRVLQERVVSPLGTAKTVPVDIKLVCATHRKLKTLIAEDRFREDLYYRLNGLTMRLPALRDRTDLAALVRSVLQAEAGSSWVIAPEVMALFEHHAWPGNLRQLTNVLRTAVALAGSDRVITRATLGDDFLDDCEAFSAPMPHPTLTASAHGGSLVAMERTAMQGALAQHGGNVSAACRELGMSRNTFYRRLKAEASGSACAD
jgi:sigma-54 dependent transcriptional regulator, acetoin dehydrogenase operon transcriptional activator AcoR